MISHVSGEVPFVLVVGKDVTISDLTNGSLFLKGECIAGKLTSLLLEYLYELEHQFGQFIERPRFDRLIPFVDLFPLGNTLKIFFVEFIYQYLEITNSFIVVTFSSQVAAIVTQKQRR